ncbi:MAG: hypothetical protein QNJ97_26830 [Myxococcota bacterium]|nr:hypothetical protein [Myxococcota bacterium]
MKKKILLYVVVFIMGTLVGMFPTLWASKDASKVVVSMVKLKYEEEQKSLAKSMMEDGNEDMAVHYFRNLVDLSNPGLESFDKADYHSTLDFPFSAIFLYGFYIKRNDKHADALSKYKEGMYRAMLGLALEKEGELDKAKHELMIASRLLKCEGNIDKARETAQKMIKEIQTTGELSN